eukprot:COSAG06_NODE_5237_length_3619_cov_2.313920_6_plen_316_part_00
MIEASGSELGALLTDYRQAFVSTSAQVMDASMKEAGASPKVRAILRMIDAGATYSVRGKVGQRTVYSGNRQLRANPVAGGARTGRNDREDGMGGISGVHAENSAGRDEGSGDGCRGSTGTGNAGRAAAGERKEEGGGRGYANHAGKGRQSLDTDRNRTGQNRKQGVRLRFTSGSGRSDNGKKNSCSRYDQKVASGGMTCGHLSLGHLGVVPPVTPPLREPSLSFPTILSNLLPVPAAYAAAHGRSTPKVGPYLDLYLNAPQDCTRAAAAAQHDEEDDPPGGSVGFSIVGHDPHPGFLLSPHHPIDMWLRWRDTDR